MGLCLCSCNCSNELSTIKKKDKSNINIENLDEQEDKFLNTDNQEIKKAQELIEEIVPKIPRLSLNPHSNGITNNIIINNIVISPHSKSDVRENDRLETFDSKNSLISINIRKRPIFAKLNTRKSSKN
jgi:hypothetical protein